MNKVIKRISKRQLEELDRRLSERDKAILASLQKCRYLTTGQLKRLHFTENTGQSAALRATSRGLNKIQDYGLIESLERRIGGVRAGSGSYIWALTDAGARILNIGSDGHNSRKRFFEPSPAFLEHTLAISETFVKLNEICGQNQMTLAKTELEPACWRGYTDENGKPAFLKPDLFAVTTNGEYEDRWFLEIDLATESPCVVIEKCKRYALYYKGGAEQKKTGVFPLVAWVVPSASRKASLQRNISGCKELKVKNIFLIITPNEFETLIRDGAGGLSGKGEK